MNTRDAHPEPIATIDELCTVLATTNHALKIEELRGLASRLRLPALQWRKYLTFGLRQFSYRTIYESSCFEVNIIGWRSGQFSSIHDHQGSACCVLVLDGVFTNIDYVFDTPDALRGTRKADLGVGEIQCRSDGEIHRCGNAQSGETKLATLHLYSPPLQPLAVRQRHE
ncbi:cysteine dioxygenase [Allorhodopirellula solitaria]|uniref:cysteine dioxygenase n=1 Tax=Allorhodopirellula solitaria TaxID=2527987 RepID=UPI0011B3FB3D|nr:cysteine dioxygenase family protein [Allorhodopirellula solitaria]